MRTFIGGECAVTGYRKKGYLKNEFEYKIQFIVPIKFYLIQICLYVPFPKSFLFGYNFKCFILNFSAKGV